MDFKLKWRRNSVDDGSIVSYYLTRCNIVFGCIKVINITKNFHANGSDTRFDAEWYDAFYREGAKERAIAATDKTLKFIISRIEQQAKLYLEMLCLHSESSVTVNCADRETIELPELG